MGNASETEGWGDGRDGESHLKRWLLLDAHRSTITIGLLAGLFVALIAVASLDVVPLRAIMQSKSPTNTLFNALVGGIITGVTLVVTINQLVLSQELGAVGDQRSRMRESMEFRQDVEDAVGLVVGPPEPATFLRALVEGTGRKAATVRDRLSDGTPVELRDAVDEYVADLRENADAVAGGLERAQFGSFSMLAAVLDYDYSWKIYRARTLRNEHRDTLSDDQLDAFDELVDVLSLFGPAREHFKTLYFQWELINLSRDIMYAALPSLVVAIAGIVYVDAGVVSGTTLGVDHLVWLVAGMVTVTLTPFVLLLSYVLRIATVAKRTLAMGPFVLQETDRADEIHWE